MAVGNIIDLMILTIGDIFFEHLLIINNMIYILFYLRGGVSRERGSKKIQNRISPKVLDESSKKNICFCLIFRGEESGAKKMREKKFPFSFRGIKNIIFLNFNFFW